MARNLASIRGCLLGLAVGDAMGYSVDKLSWEEICENYGPNGLLGYDLANGTADGTSYTQLAAFLCNGLLLGLTRGNPSYYHRYIALSAQEWAKSQQFRTTPEKTACWVAQVPAMRRRHCMDTRMLDGLTRPTLGTPEKPVLISTTPGALTTGVAVGICYDEEKMSTATLGKLGIAASALTHGDPETFLCGAFLAYAVASILQTPELPLPEQFEKALESLAAQFAETYPQVEQVEKKVRRALALTKDPELSALAAMTLLECVTASDCLAGAVFAATVHCHNFDEAMIASVNHSGRSAAVGAVTGALLGAKLGFDALPEFYLESLETADVLEELARDIFEGRQASRIFDDSWDQKYVQGLPV